MQEKKFLEEYDVKVAAHQAEAAEHTARVTALTDQAPPSGSVDEAEHEKAVAALVAQAPVHPEKGLRREFARLVSNRELVMQHPKVIAVHCTHGYNRTGFMISNYLMRAFPGHYSVAMCLKACAPLGTLCIVLIAGMQ